MTSDTLRVASCASDAHEHDTPNNLATALGQLQRTYDQTGFHDVGGGHHRGCHRAHMAAPAALDAANAAGKLAMGKLYATAAKHESLIRQVEECKVELISLPSQPPPASTPDTLPTVPKIPPLRGGESVIRITLGWAIDRSITPEA